MGLAYIYPPRPKGTIPPTTLKNYQKEPWMAQRKFNGTRNLIHIFPDRRIEFFGRKHNPHLQWSPNKEVIADILSLDLQEGLEYWIDSELLNNKTTSLNYKNKIVIFDVLFAGKYLFNGPTTLQRYEMLEKICHNPTQLESGSLALEVTNTLMLAQNFPCESFVEEYKRYIARDEIEGLVLKNKNAKIDNFGQKEYEVSWQVRCRKSTKNYKF